MADANAGNGPERPVEEGSGSGENTPPRNRTQVVLPASVERIFRSNPHISDWLPRMNAHYCYLEHKCNEDRKKAALERKETKRQRTEEQKRTQDSAYPPQGFVAAGPNPKYDGTDVKGSVVLPDSFVSVCVEGCVVNIEPDGNHVVLVLHVLSGSSQQYIPTLCPVSCLPRVVAKRWEKQLSKKRKKEWASVDFDTHPVRRDSVDMHFVTAGPLSNFTCNGAMAESLRSFFVLAVRTDSSSRYKYGASPVRFDKGREMQSSEVCVVQLDGGIMHLKYPARGTQDVPGRILSSAVAARNKLLEEAPNSTLKGALCAMERNSSSPVVTDRHRCINVALGGDPVLGEYGKFIPCKVLSERYQFPNGSFAATPCSCDIELPEGCPPMVTKLVRNANAANGKKKGHNNELSRKR